MRSLQQARQALIHSPVLRLPWPVSAEASQLLGFQQTPNLDAINTIWLGKAATNLIPHQSQQYCIHGIAAMAEFVSRGPLRKDGMTDCWSGSGTDRILCTMEMVPYLALVFPVMLQPGSLRYDVHASSSILRYFSTQG